MIRWVASLGAACALGTAGPASARPTPTRTMILFDNSGSMQTSDPRRLAESAALLYVQLAKKSDRVGLVVFDGRARVTIPLGSSPPRRRTFSRRLRRLRLDGATTDIGRALDVGLDALGPPRPGVKDVVVLLTDGRVDLGRARQQRLPQERQRIVTEVVDRYRERDVPLYTIAFTDASDRGLMEEIAGRTQGAFRYIENARELHRAFSDLFVVASGTSSLPVRDGAVVVDSSVGQTSLVMSKTQPGARNTVVAPDEEVLNPASRRKGVKWRSADSYDLVELKSPQAGAWQMQGADGKPPPAVALIQDSSLDLEVKFGPKEATVDDTMRFTVELVDNGARVKSFRRLKSLSVEAQIEHPSRKRRTILFEAGPEPGLFVGRFEKPGAPGQYGVTITAMSPALQRQWKGSFTVRPRCFEHKVRLDEPEPVIMVRLAADCPVYRDVRVEVARHIDLTHAKWIPVDQNQTTGIFGTRLEPLGPGEKGVARVRVNAVTTDGFEINYEPDPVRLPEASGDQWILIVGKRLAIINIPLLVFGGIGFAIYRAMRAKADMLDD